MRFGGALVKQVDFGLGIKLGASVKMEVWD